MASRLKILSLAAFFKQLHKFEEDPLPSDASFPTDRLILVSQWIDNSGNITCTYRKGSKGEA